MLPAHVHKPAIVKGVAAAVAATTALWFAKSAASPKPRSVTDAVWPVKTEVMKMAAPRQASAEPVLVNPFRRPVV
jgi:hypothetical protein